MKLSSILQEIAGTAGDGGSIIYDAFGGQDNFRRTLKEIDFVDGQYGEPKLHRDYFNRASGTNETLVARFRDGLLKWQPEKRPSLPALALKILRQQGINVTDARALQDLKSETVRVARATMLVAALAEMVHGQAPGADSAALANDYHDSRHTGHVAAVGDLFIQRQNYAQADQAETLMGRLVAFAHDIGHPGRANPLDQPLLNEENSFRAIEPILRAFDIPAGLQAMARVMIHGTSPDGPHALMKAAAASWRNGRQPVALEIDPGNTFESLKPLYQNQMLSSLAANLGDADTAVSVAGSEANRVMSDRLTSEFRKAGLDRDCRDPKARLFLCDYIVGADGLASQGGRDTLNEVFNRLRKDAIAQAQATITRPQQTFAPV